MLVIPAIEIKNAHCLRTVVSTGAVESAIYSDDPAEMAMLWRKENAKTLHVTDYDGLYGGGMSNFDAIVSIARHVEIPVGLLARTATIEECQSWLDAGIYRLVVHDLVQREPESVRALVERYGASRVVAGAITRGGVTTTTWRDVEPIDAVEFAAIAAGLGTRRLFFTDRDYEGVLMGPNFSELRRIAANTDMHITAAGGVASVEQLWTLQQMEAMGVDSVVIGRAFYENRFACQQLWRDVELERMQQGESWRDEISTSKLNAAKGDDRIGSD